MKKYAKDRYGDAIAAYCPALYQTLPTTREYAWTACVIMFVTESRSVPP